MIGNEEIKCSRNNQLGIFDRWGPTFEIRFKFKINHFKKGIWTEILRFTAKDGDCCLIGQRLPVILTSKSSSIHRALSKVPCIVTALLGPDTKSICVSTQIDNRGGEMFDIDGIQEGRWYSVTIKQFEEEVR